MVDATSKKPPECEQLNDNLHLKGQSKLVESYAEDPQSSNERTVSVESLTSKETCYPPDPPSDLSSISGDSEHQNEGLEGSSSALQIEEETSIPPIMDLQRLQTDEETYFSQSVLPPMMDIQHLQTDKDAHFSDSPISVVMMDFRQLHSSEEPSFFQSVAEPSKDMPQLQTDDEAHLSESSIPPPMDLHRLQTDEEVHFPRYVASPECDSSIPYPTPKSLAMTSPFPPSATSPEYYSNIPSAMTMSPTMALPASPPADACKVLSLSSLLQSPSGNTLGTAADTNPSSLPASHATFSGINEPIPSAPVLSPSTTPHANSFQNHKNETDLPDNALMQLDTVSCDDTFAESEVRAVHRMRPTVPRGGNECTEARQPQVVKPCTNQDKTAQQIQDMSLGKNKKLGKRFSKGGLVPNEGPTTLMIRGIPCGICQEEFLTLMDNAGLKGKYDFFYLPTDKNKSTGNKIVNLGYAFVNFVDHQSAEHCTTTFTDVPLAPRRSLKKCTISPADIQGIPSLRKHFKGTAMRHDARGPIFLKL
eukprot:gnl/MRDRNA2_/MRDRNA2_79585_c0_seq4.p1 gnl/MRDRNA2_/MRDRNA2_79585_c0~~gnl/MRDRNA2_/MRDRNA2_79585_c0_seq4.p1  ORF type:complete len:533 (-),score=87.16 gnl/MRDRNA2_/MRDRNA2_79585_c0_seq4:471-2069(-)